jgi:hypothetical protein
VGEAPGSEQFLAERAGQASRSPQQLVEHEDPSEIPVERVLRGEADPGQDLLAVAAG